MNPAYAQAERRELGRLVLHQRNQGRNHQSCSAQRERRQLVAERLAKASRHHQQQVAPVDGGAANGLLIRPELSEAEDRAQQFRKLKRLGQRIRIMRSRQTEKRPRRKEAAREMRSASFNFTAAASAHAFASLSACCRINYLQGFENKYRWVGVPTLHHLYPTLRKKREGWGTQFRMARSGQGSVNSWSTDHSYCATGEDYFLQRADVKGRSQIVLAGCAYAHPAKAAEGSRATSFLVPVNQLARRMPSVG